MEQEINKKFETSLFSQLDIDYVKEQIDEHLPLLYMQKCSLDNTTQIEKIEKQINSVYNTEIKKLFRKYQNLLNESIAQQNCLAYYLGIKRGLDLKNDK